MPQRDRRSGAAPLDMSNPEGRCASECSVAFAWSGIGSRSARPARKTSLFGKPALEAGRDEKARSVVALSRVPRLAGFAGSPPAAGLFWRLTGLLSGSPPTDTRPQARAKLGKLDKICESADITSDFFAGSFRRPAAAMARGCCASAPSVPLRAQARCSGKMPCGKARKPITSTLLPERPPSQRWSCSLSGSAQ